MLVFDHKSWLSLYQAAYATKQYYNIFTVEVDSTSKAYSYNRVW